MMEMPVFRIAVATAARTDSQGCTILSRAICYVVATDATHALAVLRERVPVAREAPCEVLDVYTGGGILVPVRIGSGEPRAFHMVSVPPGVTVRDATLALFQQGDPWRRQVELGLYEVGAPVRREVVGVY